MQWKTALMAHGAGAKGNWEKCLLVKAIPNPEFCIPTSMDIVLRTSSSIPKSFAKKYPNEKPSRWRQETERSNFPQCCRIRSFFAEITYPTIKRINNTEMMGEKDEIFLADWEKKRFQTRPTINGNNTITTTLLNKTHGSTGTYWPAKSKTRLGVKKTARKVETRVKATDRATPPFAK